MRYQHMQSIFGHNSFAENEVDQLRWLLHKDDGQRQVNYDYIAWPASSLTHIEPPFQVSSWLTCDSNQRYNHWPRLVDGVI